MIGNQIVFSGVLRASENVNKITLGNGQVFTIAHFPSDIALQCFYNDHVSLGIGFQGEEQGGLNSNSTYTTTFVTIDNGENPESLEKGFDISLNSGGESANPQFIVGQPIIGKVT